MNQFTAAALITFFLALFSLPAQAQIEDLTKYRGFFQDQMRVYQDWLDRTGLGKTLWVQDLVVNKEELSLYLAFPYQNVDSIMVAWRTLKADFEEQYSLTLEERLFYKMVSLMEVRQSIANVQIYNTYDLRKTPVFFRGIHFEDGVVKVEEDNPRSEIRDIDFAKNEFNDRFSLEEFDNHYDDKAVFQHIINFAKKKFEAGECSTRQPQVDELQNSNGTLRFEVIDLCREVLKDEGIICPILRRLRIKCDWPKRELLIFTVKHRPTRDGFMLNLTIDGKFGPAIYESVRRGAYMSMEKDFDGELKRYADRITRELKRYILQSSP